MFWLPLSRAVGLSQPQVCKDITIFQELVTTTCDWRVASMGWMYTFFVLLGASAAIWGGGSYGIDKGGFDARTAAFWAFVGIPLAWGVWITLQNALKIF